MEPLYKLTVTGLRDVVDLSTLKPTLQALFKTDAASMDKLLHSISTGERLVVARNLPLSRIKQHQATLEQAGLMCAREPCLALAPIEEEQYTCPACGFTQPSAPDIANQPCPKCGIVGSKYVLHQSRDKLYEREKQNLLNRQGLVAEEDRRAEEEAKKLKQREEIRQRLANEFKIPGAQRKQAMLAGGALATVLAVTGGYAAYVNLQDHPPDPSGDKAIATAQKPQATPKQLVVAVPQANAPGANAIVITAPEPTLSPADETLSSIEPQETATSSGNKTEDSQASPRAEPAQLSQPRAPIAPVDPMLANRAIALAHIAQDQAASDNLEAAQETLRQAIVMAEEVATKTSDRRTLDAVTVVHAEVLGLQAEHKARTDGTSVAQEFFTQALNLVTGLKNQVDQVAILGVVAKHQAIAGQRPSSQETFQRASEIANGMANPTERLTSLSLIAEELARAGEIDAATAHLDRITTAAQDPGNAPPADTLALHQTEVLAAIAEADARSGLLDKARSTFAQAVEKAEGLGLPNQRALALSLVAKAEAESADGQTVLTRLEKVRMLTQPLEGISEYDALVAKVKRHSIETLGLLAKRQAREGDSRAAGEGFAKALQIAESIKNPAERAVLLSITAKYQVDAGDIEGSRRHFAQALQLAGWANPEVHLSKN
jgi:tetratricopeptide (TPR) repeat protein